MPKESEDKGHFIYLFQTPSDDCEVCGKSHQLEKCDLLNCSIEHVKDTPSLSYARLTLPDGLDVKELSDGTKSVITTKPFHKGVQFGPFIAKTSALMDVRIEFPLKVFLSEEGSVYLESYEELFCNWMCLVSPAGNSQEQNLYCYQVGTSIYFCTIRDIEKGQELKVWYSPYYAEKMGVHSFSKPPDLIHSSDEEFQEIYTALQNGAEAQDHTYIPKLKKKRRKLPKKLILGENYYRAVPPNDVLPGELLGAVERRKEWNCKHCGQVETNVAAYARHLMEHYKYNVETLLCPYCHKKFRTEDNRRFHINFCKENQAQKDADTVSATNINQFDKPKEITSYLRIPGHGEAEVESKTPKDNLESLLRFENISSSIHSENHTESNSLDDTRVTSFNMLDVKINDNILDTESNIKKTGDVNEIGSKSLTSTQLQELPADTGHMDSQTLQSRDIGDKCGWSSVNLGNKFEGLENMKIPSLNVGEKNNWTKDNKSFESERNVCLESLEENLVSKSLILDLSDDLDFNISKSFDEIINEDCNLDKSLSFPKSKCSELFSMPGPSLLMPDTQMAQASILDSAPFYSLDKNGFLQSSFTSCDDVTDEERNRIVENLLSETDEKYLDYEMTDGCVSDSVCNNENKMETEKAVGSSRKTKTKKGGEFKCDICTQSFHKRIYLYRHLRKHTGEFRCNVCYMVFARKETLQTHRLSCSLEAPTQETITSMRIHCKICKQYFHSIAAMQDHLEKHYCQGETWKCECETVSNNPLLIENHNCPRSLVSVKCVKCHRVYSSSQDFIDHKNRFVIKTRTRHKDFSAICEICGLMFKSFDKARVHRRYAHVPKSHECPICNKKFSRKDIMMDHSETHKQPIWECGECKKMFSSQKQYKTHFRALHMHSDVKFVCQKCNKEFRQKGNLFKHMKIHNSGNQVSCKYCDKQFANEIYLENHMKRHLDNTLYECSICDKTVATRWQLKTHVRRSHNEMYKCVYCNLPVRYRHTLKKHLMSKHCDKREEWDSSEALIAMMEPKSDQSVLPNGKRKDESCEPACSSIKDILQTAAESIMNENSEDGGLQNKVKHRKIPNIIKSIKNKTTVSSTKSPAENISSLQLMTINVSPTTGSNDGTELMPTDMSEALINLPISVISNLQIATSQPPPPTELSANLDVEQFSDGTELISTDVSGALINLPISVISDLQIAASQSPSSTELSANLDVGQIPDTVGLVSTLDGTIVNFPFALPTLPEGFQLTLSEDLTEKDESVTVENSTLINVDDLQGIDSTSAFVLTDGSVVQSNLDPENQVLYYIIGDTESNLL